jgi:hypothetical protein
MRNTTPNQIGASLVSALLVLALVTAIAIGLSVVIMNQVNTTRDITYAMSSYYAADSSLDQGLWIIKQGRWDNLSLDGVAGVLDKLNTTGTLSNSNAKWKRTAVKLNETVKFDLGTEQSATVELYNPDNPTVFSDAPQKIQVTWDDDIAHAEKVQVAWSGWDQDGFDAGNGQIYPYPRNDIVTLAVGSEQPTRIYLRIKAKDYGVTNLSVKSYKLNGNAINIPSQIKLTVTGQFPDGSITSKQALGASVPWLVPISGLYSYVLYSSDSLNK